MLKFSLTIVLLLNYGFSYCGITDTNITQQQNEDSLCQMCLDTLEETQTVVQCNCQCKVAYHKECIEPWILEKKSCPQCSLPTTIETLKTLQPGQIRKLKPIEHKQEPIETLLPIQDSQNQEHNCLICLDAIQESQEQAQGNCSCKALYHKDCLLKWLSIKEECPQCKKFTKKQDIRTTKPKEIEEVPLITPSSFKQNECYQCKSEFKHNDYISFCPKLCPVPYHYQCLVDAEMKDVRCPSCKQAIKNVPDGIRYQQPQQQPHPQAQLPKQNHMRLNKFADYSYSDQRPAQQRFTPQPHNQVRNAFTIFVHDAFIAALFGLYAHSSMVNKSLKDKAQTLAILSPSFAAIQFYIYKQTKDREIFRWPFKLGAWGLGLLGGYFIAKKSSRI